MKPLFLFIATTGILTACNNSTDQKSTTAAKNSDLIGQNLKGKVQNYEETTFTVDSTGVGKKDSIINVVELDEKGYQVKYLGKDTTGKIHTEQTLSRDSSGNFTGMITLTDGKQTYKLVTEFTKEGKYTGGKSFDSSGKQTSYYTDLVTTEYGQVSAGKEHFMDGRVKSTWDYKFEGPNFVGGTSTDSTGKPNYTGTVKLNDKGDPIEEESTTREKDATKTEKVTYKYDSFDDTGNWTSRTTYNEKGKPTKTVKRAFTYYKD